MKIMTIRSTGPFNDCNLVNWNCLVQRSGSKVTTEWLILSRHQEQAVASGHLVGVVSELSALLASGAAAAEALASLELVVALAGEGREAALRVDGVSEELVGSPVVAQVVVGVVGAVVSWKIEGDMSAKDSFCHRALKLGDKVPQSCGTS